MFNFWKKKNIKPQEPEAFNAWAFVDLKKEPVKISEPWTFAKHRLENGANDFGSAKGQKMYNSHLTKVQNQWVNPLQSVNSGYGNSQLSFYNYQNVNYFECYALAQDPLFNKIFNILSRTPFAKGGEVAGDLSAEEKQAIEAGAKKFRVWEEIVNAVRSNYVSGGCLLFMDFGLNNLEEPLNLKNLDMRDFRGFRHIDPINVVAIDVNTTEPAAWDYMKPSKWNVVLKL